MTRSNQIQSLEAKIEYLFESERLRDLLNEFAYALDACLANPDTLDIYVSLFSDDCRLTFPFGTFEGKDGMKEMVLKAESRFHCMVVSSHGVCVCVC